MPNLARTPLGRRIRRVWPLIVLAFFLMVAVVYNESLQDRATLGQPAPDFGLEDLDGNLITLADHRGKTVFLNFWATWCTACIEEMPAHQTFLERYGDRVEVIAINLREPTRRINEYKQDFAKNGRPLTMTMLRDKDGRVADKYRLKAVPESWFVDGDGIAKVSWIGPITFEQMQQAYHTTTGMSLDAGGVGPIAEGTTLQTLALSEGDLTVGTDHGMVTGRIENGTAVVSAVTERGKKGVVDVYNSYSSFFAAVPGQGLVRREDSDEWTTLDPLAGADVLAVAGDVLNKHTLYAWVDGSGVMRSDDSGMTWIQVSQVPGPNLDSVSLAVVPGQPNRLFMGTTEGVFESRDGGVSWRSTGVQSPVYGIAVAPGPSLRIYVATEKGILVSEDGARTARQLMGSPQRILHAVATDPANSDTVLVGSPNGDLYLSEDGGSSWAYLPWAEQ